MGDACGWQNSSDQGMSLEKLIRDLLGDEDAVPIIERLDIVQHVLVPEIAQDLSASLRSHHHPQVSACLFRSHVSFPVFGDVSRSRTETESIELIASRIDGNPRSHGEAKAGLDDDFPRTAPPSRAAQGSRFEKVQRLANPSMAERISSTSRCV